MTTSDPILVPLETMMRKRLVKYLVQKAIFCPATGAVLDVRTCVVILDSDGDPTAVLSQEGWAALVQDPERMAVLAERGMVADPKTVRL